MSSNLTSSAMKVLELIKALQEFPNDARIRIWVENPEMEGVPVVDSYLDDETQLVLQEYKLENAVVFNILPCDINEKRLATVIKIIEDQDWFSGEEVDITYNPDGHDEYPARLSTIEIVSAAKKILDKLGLGE